LENEKAYMLWLKDKHKYFEEFLKANKEMCLDCRKHCNQARAVCEPKLQAANTEITRMRLLIETIAENQAAIFARLREAELKLAGIAKGAYIIAGGATFAVIVGKILHYF